MQLKDGLGKIEHGTYCCVDGHYFCVSFVLLFFFDEVRFEDDEKIEKYAVQIECYGNNTRIVLLW